MASNAIITDMVKPSRKTGRGRPGEEADDEAAWNWAALDSHKWRIAYIELSVNFVRPLGVRS